jgi:hypothetical protein
MLRIAVPVMSTFLTPKVLVPNRGGDSGVHRLRMCSVRERGNLRNGKWHQVRAIIVRETCLPKVT